MSLNEYGPNAPMPEKWPPEPEEMTQALTDIFGQHVVGQRDALMRKVFEIVVHGEPYASGRVHQRPFTALQELHLSEEALDKLVDVIAVFVDEAIEDCLRLVGSVTNSMGDYYTMNYRITAEIQEHKHSRQERYNIETLAAGLRDTLGRMVSEEGELEEEPELDLGNEFPVTQIGTGEALWFEYRKWLNRYCQFRRSARPSHA